jgi:hypothetical protein
MKNKQTAVEWFAEMTSKLGYVSADILEQAKEMHKQEIENSYLTCYEEYTAYGKHWEMGMNPKETFEQYYNETYGGNNLAEPR